VLAAVDHDADLGEAARTSARDARAGSGGRDDLARLPEDALPARGQGREDELRTVLARPVEDQIDRDASATTEGDRDLLDDLGVSRPPFLDAGAEDPARPWLGVPDLEDQATIDRQANEIRQSRVRVGIPRDDEVHIKSLRRTAASLPIGSQSRGRDRASSS
jgi:hypothetical protein